MFSVWKTPIVTVSWFIAGHWKSTCCSSACPGPKNRRHKLHAQVRDASTTQLFEALADQFVRLVDVSTMQVRLEFRDGCRLVQSVETSETQRPWKSRGLLGVAWWMHKLLPRSGCFPSVARQTWQAKFLKLSAPLTHRHVLQ